MDQESRAFLRRHGVQEPAGSGLYLLHSNFEPVLAEDLASLLGSLEHAYRRLLPLVEQPDARRLLAQRIAQGARLSGVSKSLEKRYDLLTSYKGSRKSSSTSPDISRIWEETSHRRVTSDEKLIVARAELSSPGFIEMAGDPLTLKLLTSLLILVGLRLQQRRDDRVYGLALADNQRENARLLQELGFSGEEIKAVREYLSDNLSTILRKLEDSGLRLAPGDDLDPPRLPPGDAQGPEDDEE